MAYMVWWFVPVVVLFSITIGVLLNLSGAYLPEDIHKFMIIFSFFSMIGICALPVEDTENQSLNGD